MLQVINGALADIRAGFKMRRVWVALASEDIGDQHRRTALGPFWLLINYLAFAATFLIIFANSHTIPNFAGYVAIGLLVWLYISEVITQSVSLFVREESFIQGTTLPLTVYVMRLAMQSSIRAGYALAGCLAILLLSGTPVTVGWLWSALAIGLLLVTTPAVITICAFGGAFFPDLQFIVQNFMRLGLFMTPVFWAPSSNEIRNAFYYFNPFTYFLEIVRWPIIGGVVPLRSFGLCLCLCLMLWSVAILLLGRFRKQIVFVV